MSKDLELHMQCPKDWLTFRSQNSKLGWVFLSRNIIVQHLTTGLNVTRRNLGEQKECTNLPTSDFQYGLAAPLQVWPELSWKIHVGETVCATSERKFQERLTKANKISTTNTSYFIKSYIYRK